MSVSGGWTVAECHSVLLPFHQGLSMWLRYDGFSKSSCRLSQICLKEVCHLIIKIQHKIHSSEQPYLTSHVRTEVLTDSMGARWEWGNRGLVSNDGGWTLCGKGTGPQHGRLSGRFNSKSPVCCYLSLLSPLFLISPCQGREEQASLSQDGDQRDGMLA